MEPRHGLFEHVEALVQAGVEWLRLGIETLGAAIVAFGVVVTAISLVRHALARRSDGYRDIRVTFARYLLLALELQLAADILSTAIAPTWDRIGKLAAIAVIRTVLNHFLSREMRDEMQSKPLWRPSDGDRGQRAGSGGGDSGNDDSDGDDRGDDRRHGPRRDRDPMAPEGPGGAWRTRR